MSNFLTNWIWHPILDVLFPKCCAACNSLLQSKEEILCISCRYQLPFTEMEKIPENEAAIKFYTKLKLEHAASLLYFVEEGMVRPMLHKLKYKNQSEIGYFLGKLLAERFSPSGWLNDIDVILPIPLHYKKQHLRGYNQATLIAEGIGDFIKKPVCDNAVIRVKNTASQTQMSRSRRLENVNNAFSLAKPGKDLEDRHILLIDDVLTTGATLASCGRLLLEKTRCKLSIATVAIAHH
jgi:ComF family protein